MIKNHLSKLLGERRMTQSELAKRTGIRPSTINEWYHEFIVRMNVDHMERICEVLDCQLSDLIEYIPNAQKRTGKDLIIETHGNQKKGK